MSAYNDGSYIIWSSINSVEFKDFVFILYGNELKEKISWICRLSLRG